MISGQRGTGFKKWRVLFRRLVAVVVFTLAFLTLTGAAPAPQPLEIIAPGGGEIDFQSNIAKYYSEGSNLVEAHWIEYLFIAEYIEVNRDLQTLQGHGKVKITQNSENARELLCNEFVYDRHRDYLSATGGVNFHSDQESAFSGGRFEWDRKSDLFKLEEQPKVTYQDWVIRGSRMDGQIVKGLLNVNGSAEATNGEMIATGGQMILNRGTNKLIIRENPIVVQRKNEMSAKEITYDLKTKRVSAIGPVKSRIIDEEQR